MATFELLSVVHHVLKFWFQRWSSLRDSCDAFPMHLILIRTDMISRIYKEKISPIAHVKILEVAGRTDMCYIDDFLIKKVTFPHKRTPDHLSILSACDEHFTSAISKSGLRAIFLRYDAAIYDGANRYGLFWLQYPTQHGTFEFNLIFWLFSQIGQSFFFHMGMNKQIERIPYVDVHEKKLLIKLNSFFSVAKHAMDRKRYDKVCWSNLRIQWCSSIVAFKRAHSLSLIRNRWLYRTQYCKRGC